MRLNLVRRELHFSTFLKVLGRLAPQEEARMPARAAMSCIAAGRLPKAPSYLTAPPSSAAMSFSHYEGFGVFWAVS